MEKTTKIEISARTIVFTVALLIFLNLLWMIKDLIFSLFIAFIIMSAVKPAVSRLERIKIPRQLSTVLIFVVLIFIIVYLFFWIIPPIVIETGALIKNLPAMIASANPEIGKLLNLGAITQYLPDITGQVFSLIRGVFSNAVFLFSTIFFSFYFTIEENLIKELLIKFFGEKETERAALIFEKAEERMSAWFWGELVLMTIVGLLTYLGLSLIGVRYALPLAIIAGILEAVPNLGPTLSAIPSLLVAVVQSYVLGLSVIILYFVIQQLENQLIVPQVMKKAVGLNPIVTLIALIVGGRIGGTLGIVLAIPITLFVETLLIEIVQTRKSDLASS